MLALAVNPSLVIVRVSTYGQYADPSQPAGLLRARGERPCGSRAAESRDEFSTLHSHPSGQNAGL
jgi:hypothetical protein